MAETAHEVFRSLPHSYDPLGDTYDALLNGELIKLMAGGEVIAKEIMKYIPYIESTLKSTKNYDRGGFYSHSNDDELAHLITMPTNVKHSYILKSFKFQCYSYRLSNPTEISIKIGEFNPNKNKRIDFKSLLYESPKNLLIMEDKAYGVDDINIEMKGNKMYIIEPCVLNEDTNVGSGMFSNFLGGSIADISDFEGLKFVRSDLRYNGWVESGYYHFRNYVSKFECVWVLFK